ncbi:MAG TPA: ATP-binding protein [Solirubrobacterales bacterium]|nr:ATP-binding protein [Solirubrobacterales bacterium]
MPSAPRDRTRFELRLPADPTSVTRARHAARELAREVGANEEDVALTVSEAVSNAVVHGFRNRESGTVEVLAETRDRELRVTVADDGDGMAPDLDHSGLGLGLALISRLAAEVTFSSSTDGTTVSISFPTDADRDGDGAASAAGAREGS